MNEVSNLKKANFLHFFQLVFRSYSHVLFIDNAKLGLLVLLATFIHPNIGLSGLIALTSALILLKVFQQRKDIPVDTIYLYNPLLVGLFMGYLFRLDLISSLLITIAACLTLVTTFMLGSLLHFYRLPILSLPFTMIAVLVAVASQGYSNLEDQTYYFHTAALAAPLWEGLPPVILSFLKSIGAVFCIPDPLAGTLILVATACFSPMVVLLFFIGHSFGYFMEWLLVLGGSPLLIRSHYFNYSLVFASLVGVFLLPSWNSILLATLGTLMTTLVATASLSFWSVFQVPVLALPFNLIVLSVLHSIGVLNPTRINHIYEGTPEKNFDLSFLRWRRFRTGEVGVYCPFSGPWIILQGFSGQWTHRGEWSEALDFVKKDDKGKTYRGEGRTLNDYYAYDQPVLSPIDGYIVSVASKVEDNPPNQIKAEQNWGNHILIRSLDGIFVLVAHLKKDSVAVKIGDYVQKGTEVGRCGNSGYSPEPHIHLQVQTSAILGAPTLPFHLVQIEKDSQLLFHDIPKKGETITPFATNESLRYTFSYKVDQQLEYLCYEGDQIVGSHIISNQLDLLSGKYYLKSKSSSLSYGSYGDVFFFQGYRGNHRNILFDLYAAVPRFPTIFGNPCHFEDALPFTYQAQLSHPVRLIKTLIVGNIHPKNRYFFYPSRLSLEGEVQIFGRLVKTTAQIDPSVGIKQFTVGNRRYVLKE